jgi:hypothetical protein
MIRSSLIYVESKNGYWDDNELIGTVEEPMLTW